MNKSTKVLGITILLLLFVTITIWWALASASGGELRVTFLDVGQGDAIYVRSPSGAQLLIDAGKNREVLRELGKVMPFFDRSIDVVLATHPDADHIGGMPDVLKRYRAALVVHSSVEDEEGIDAAAFEKAMAGEVENGSQVVVAERGQVYDLGGGARLEILFPDRSVPAIETNTGSIVARLVYGETSFLFTGDSPDSIEEYLVQLDGKNLKANVLKAGHHGSRTSSSLLFVGFVSPEHAVFSRGCDNSYGHPHEEPKAVFARLGITMLDTCEDGAVTFTSDGQRVKLR